MSRLGNPDTGKIEGKTVLITGGTGFIGRFLIGALCNNCTVIALARTGKIPKIRTVNSDITDKSRLFNSLKNEDIDLVFHIAGNTNTPDHINDLDYFAINAIGTKNILELCREKNIQRIIYSSSMEVFGNTQYLPVDEAHPKIPQTYYGLSKLMGEVYCNEYAKTYGIYPTILRYSYVYGPGIPEYRVIPKFINNAFENRPLLLYNGGKETTDYIYIRDIVNANILAAVHVHAKNRDFNIGSGMQTCVEDLAKTIISLIGKGSLHFVRERDTVKKKFVFDISKAEKHLHFHPLFSLEEGLKEQIKERNR